MTRECETTRANFETFSEVLSHFVQECKELERYEWLVNLQLHIKLIDSIQEYEQAYPTTSAQGEALANILMVIDEATLLGDYRNFLRANQRLHGRDHMPTVEQVEASALEEYRSNNRFHIARVRSAERIHDECTRRDELLRSVFDRLDPILQNLKKYSYDNQRSQNKWGR